MSVSSEQLRRFYKSREKKPNLYTYDDDGNIISQRNAPVGRIIPRNAQ